MELGTLTKNGINALFNAGLITTNEDGTPQIDPDVLDRLDSGEPLHIAIRYVTQPTLATFKCPCCDAEVETLASSTLVMHHCPNRNREFRNMKRVK